MSLKLPFSKTETGLQKVERLKSEIELIELEISASKRVEETAASNVESNLPDAQSTLDKVTQRLEDLNAKLIQKQKALAGASREFKAEIEDEKMRKRRAANEKTSMLLQEALLIVGETEKGLSKVTKSYQKAIELVREARTTAPETDGTPDHDSLLSDANLVALIKLELRRGGLQLAHPWFKGERDIPTLYQGWLNGAAWLVKKSDDDIKRNGPWAEIFKKENGH